MLAQLHALRAALFHPARMQLLVAGDLSRRGAADPHVLLAAALAPPAASYAALAAASLAAREVSKRRIHRKPGDGGGRLVEKGAMEPL